MNVHMHVEIKFHSNYVAALIAMVQNLENIFYSFIFTQQNCDSGSLIFNGKSRDFF